MTARVCRAEYFHATVRDRPGEAYSLLSQLAASKVNLLAFSAIPMGEEHTQLILFPEDGNLLVRVAAERRIVLSGPQFAFFIRGDDKLGALTDVHEQLARAQINVFASSGVTADCGRFGYILYVRPADFEKAAAVLGV